MNQEAIWEHFQNEGVAAFRSALPRLEFLVRRLEPGERALNVGVGSGLLERLATVRGVDIWSLDPSERAIMAIRSSLSMGDRARVGYSQDLPFDDDSFDAVVLTEVLEHLEHTVFRQTLAEVKRVLRPGGRLIGTVPAREKLEDSMVVCPACTHKFHRWGHQASFDVEALQAALGPDLIAETVEERFFNEWHSASLPRRASGLLKKLLSWAGLGPYGIARNIYFVARKPGRTDAA